MISEVEVTDRMELITEIRQNGTNMRGGSYVNNANKPIATMSADIFNFRQENDVEIMRGDMARILYHHTQNDVEYIFGDSISSIEQDDDGVYVTFEQSDPRTFDLVVAADGLHSNVRNLTFGDESQFTQHLGCYAAIFTIPNYLDLNQWELYFSAPGKSVSIYSTKLESEAKVFFAFKSPLLSFDHRNKDQQKKILADAFAGDG
ncbi:hypothetical protein [Shimazuella kribbensis]|uniref:hypothetical protein n=1 Tax=Shimazuella kribbensis TaxID=139808 RepID=UPI000420B77C|nr:hypothetical protein [Shimazuella kribbensis]